MIAIEYSRLNFCVCVFFKLKSWFIVTAEICLDGLQMRYCCPNSYCSRSYKNKGSLSFHLKYECGRPPKYQCEICRKPFHQKSNFTKHMKRVHKSSLSPVFFHDTRPYFSPDEKSNITWRLCSVLYLSSVMYAVYEIKLLFVFFLKFIIFD